jgi:sodium-dependent phosphate transporter
VVHRDCYPWCWFWTVRFGQHTHFIYNLFLTDSLQAAIFFVPYVHAKVIKKDYTLKLYHIFLGPALFSREAPADAEFAMVPNYAVLQHGLEQENRITEPREGEIVTDPAGEKTKVIDSGNYSESDESAAPNPQHTHQEYKALLARAREEHHAELRQGKGPLGWAMRCCHRNQLGAGSIYELHNLKALVKRLPAQVVVAALYGVHYDIHKAQLGVMGTPEGKRMDRVYAHAPKYANEVEHLYSFVQIITACTASFAHGANDVGNAVGVWAAMYSAWSTGETVGSKAPVPLWQIAVIALTICIGFITYGYNIMRVMGNKITYHSPSRGSSMEMGAAITILIFSQYKLPVSTSMCITGATVGVGLMNGTFKAVNWQRVGLLFFSWGMCFDQPSQTLNVSLTTSLQL